MTIEIILAGRLVKFWREGLETEKGERPIIQRICRHSARRRNWYAKIFKIQKGDSKRSAKPPNPIRDDRTSGSGTKYYDHIYLSCIASIIDGNGNWKWHANNNRSSPIDQQGGSNGNGMNHGIVSPLSNSP